MRCVRPPSRPAGKLFPWSIGRRPSTRFAPGTSPGSRRISEISKRDLRVQSDLCHRRERPADLRLRERCTVAAIGFLPDRPLGHGGGSRESAGSPRARPRRPEGSSSPRWRGTAPRCHWSSSAISRAVLGKPAIAVAATILPDQRAAEFDGKAAILVAVQELDDAFIERIARNFGFSGLKWGEDHSDGRETYQLRSESDGPVGTLSWLPDRPGATFVRDISPLLVLALGVLIVAGAVAAAGTLRFVATDRSRAKSFFGDDEPRDLHAAQRHYRHGRPARRTGIDCRPAVEGRDHPRVQ